MKGGAFATVLVCIIALSATPSLLTASAKAEPSYRALAESAGPSLTYAMMVTSESAARHVAHVKVVLTDSKTPSVITLTMHEWLGGYAVPVPVLDFHATNEKGDRLDVRYKATEKAPIWTIATGDSKIIEVNYDLEMRYFIERVNSYAGYLGREFGIALGAFTFVIPKPASYKSYGYIIPVVSDSYRSICVSFDLPPGWRAFTPWVKKDVYFCPRDLEDLVTSTIALGDFDISSRRIEEANVTVAVFSRWNSGDKKDITDFSFKIFEHIAGIFGAWPVDHHFMAYVPPADDLCTAAWLEWSYSQGLCVWSPFSNYPRARWDMMREVVHRLFHVWNEFPPGGMQAEITDRDGTWTWWFTEGSARYYESKSLLVLGYFTDPFALREKYQDYLSQIVGTEYDLPVVRAYEAGEDYQKYFFLTYEKGALVSLLLDLTVQNVTGGHKSLDDIIGILWANYGGMKGQFSNRDILRHLSRMTEYDFSTFFKKYVYGTDKLPLDSRLTKIVLGRVTELLKVGDVLNLAATLTDFGGKPVEDEPITFYVNFLPATTATSDSQGVAKTSCRMNSTGLLDIAAVYLGASWMRLQSSDSLAVTVKPVETATTKTTTVPETEAITTMLTQLTIRALKVEVSSIILGLMLVTVLAVGVFYLRGRRK